MSFTFLQQVFGIIAGLLALISAVPYVKSILKRETIPHRTTYGLWTLLYIISLTSYIAAGARFTAFFIGAYLLVQLVIFALSFKYGTGGLEKLDILCTLGALVGIILWLITKSPLYALYLTIAAELFAFAPTIIKTYKKPYSESLSAWIIGACGGMFNIFAIDKLQPEIYIYPIFIFVLEFSLVILMLTRRPELESHLKQESDSYKN